MVKVEVIRKRLNKLDEYIAILNKLSQYSYEEFISEPYFYGSAERFLHLSVEAIIDMGNHIIADSELGVVNWYSDIPMILFEKGYIDEKLQKVWIRMIGFRNTLVHDYVDIDQKIVYDVLKNHIDDLEEFRKLFAQFL
jgi:uncharacterized protein YutE (UPF0331/DUF86 family)